MTLEVSALISILGSGLTDIEPVGVARIKEALEANDWAGGGDAGLEDGDDDAFKNTFAAEEAEMSIELFSMKGAIHGEEEDDEALQVEELEQMMQRMQTIKGMPSPPKRHSVPLLIISK